MKYKLINEFKSLVGGHPVFTVEGAISPLFLGVSWQVKTHPLSIFFINRGRNSFVALDDQEYVAIATDRFSQFFSGQVSIKELRAEYEDWEKSADLLYDRFTDTDLQSLSDEELSGLLNEVHEVFAEMCRLTIYIENVDYEKILSVVGERHKADLDLVWEKATEAVFLSFENRRLKSALDLISAGKGDLARKAKYMFTDYYWPQDNSKILNALGEIRTESEKKAGELRSVTEDVIRKRSGSEAWLKTLKGASRKIAEFAQLVMEMRDLRKDPLAKIHVMLAEISEEILTRAGVDTKCAPSVMLYEYLKGIGYIASIKDNIEKRLDGCIYIAKPDFTCVTELCDFDQAVSQAKELLEEKIEGITELKGQTACGGVVRGVVRIISDPHDEKGFQDGDILVTSMTRPEFISLMKRSGAVITNEGGITCHAAIVSRELKKPCIIGTKISTKVLKDGMEVEVDADNGIIRIIN